MVDIDITYEGDLRCQATHRPSGSRVETDAPVDNQGKGERFSPTDTVAAALGTCMATIMGIFSKRHDIDLRGMRVHVAKTMSAEPPRRIARLAVEIHVPLAVGHPRRQALENAAHTCPVYRSIHPEIEVPVVFHWEG